MGQKKGDIYLSAYDSETTTTDSPDILDPFGRIYTEEIEEFSRKQRTANARLVKDIVNKKQKLSLEFSEIDGASLAVIESYYELDSELYLTNFTDDGVSESWIVLMSPYKKTRWKMNGDGLFTNVSFLFEEV